jgi:ferritin-like metal-binding protein YciE
MFFAERGTGEPISLGAALLAGKKVPPDITALLTEDHRTVLGWFSWFQAAHAQDKPLIQANILCALWAHMAAEEELFYPALAAKLGDAKLVERARAEHEAAKKLMRALENDAGDRESNMASLRDEIAHHILEEEGLLFPLARETDLDLYSLGRACAARRVERLADLNGRNINNLKETAGMPISKDEAREFLVIGLRDIHATVSQGKTMVQAQLKRLENYPILHEKLQAHAAEKDMQLARVERILKDLSSRPSTFKDSAMSALGTVTSASTMMAGDEIIKNSFTMYGLANFEAAAYETLILFAEVAEQYDALEPLQLSLNEERAMATFIAENLRGTGLRFLSLRTENRQASH